MKALSRLAPCLVLVMTAAPPLALGQAPKNKAPDATNLKPTDAAMRPSNTCPSCVDQDTNPKTTTEGTGGTDHPGTKKVMDPNVKIKVVTPDKKAPPAKGKQ